jgi:hypothetical protein
MHQIAKLKPSGSVPLPKGDHVAYGPWEPPDIPSRVMGSSTFSKALIVAIRLNVWNTNPIFERRNWDCEKREEIPTKILPLAE